MCLPQGAGVAQDRAAAVELLRVAAGAAALGMRCETRILRVGGAGSPRAGASPARRSSTRGCSTPKGSTRGAHGAAGVGHTRSARSAGSRTECAFHRARTRDDVNADQLPGKVRSVTALSAFPSVRLEGATHSRTLAAETPREADPEPRFGGRANERPSWCTRGIAGPRESQVPCPATAGPRLALARSRDALGYRPSRVRAGSRAPPRARRWDSTGTAAFRPSRHSA